MYMPDTFIIGKSHRLISKDRFFFPSQNHIWVNKDPIWLSASETCFEFTYKFFISTQFCCINSFWISIIFFHCWNSQVTQQIHHYFFLLQAPLGTLHLERVHSYKIVIINTIFFMSFSFCYFLLKYTYRKYTYIEYTS